MISRDAQGGVDFPPRADSVGASPTPGTELTPKQQQRYELMHRAVVAGVLHDDEWFPELAPLKPEERKAVMAEVRKQRASRG